MIELKPLSVKGIPDALERARRYRLLNDPEQAESICQDVLLADPDNKLAIIELILALTDQFANKGRGRVTKAREWLTKLTSEYDKSYYGGMIAERRAKAAFKLESPHSKYIAYDLFREAMKFYEEAERIRPDANEESLLRWNSCARMIMTYELKEQPGEDYFEPLLD